MIEKRVRDKLSEFSSALKEVDEKRFKKESELAVSYRNGEIEKHLQERQAVLAKIDGFWGTAFGGEGSPIAPLMNKTVDPKIARAITAFEVKFFTQEGKGIRKLVLTLRPNMYTEAGEISRTIDSEGNTTDIQEIKWKQGTEKVRKDSVFSLFTASDDMDPFFIQETFDAFDGLYQNPFI